MSKPKASGSLSTHVHRDGHTMGDRNKLTSHGDRNRKSQSLKGRKKAYRGQGR